jgi:hypothetical protein
MLRAYSSHVLIVNIFRGGVHFLSAKALKVGFRDEPPSKNNRGRPTSIRDVVERVGMEQHEIGLLSDRDGALRRDTAKKFGWCTRGRV